MSLNLHLQQLRDFLEGTNEAVERILKRIRLMVIRFHLMQMPMAFRPPI